MNKLLVLCGPTATGKTALAITVAKQLNGELISADSRQVYRGMDIATGKDLPADKAVVKNSSFSVVHHNTSYTLHAYNLNGIPVWMYDVVNPDEDFSVSHYAYLAHCVMSDIWSRGKIPIVVGGTGFYISSLISPPASLNVPRDENLREILASCSVIELQKRLKQLDPNVYSALNNSDMNNPRRLVRKIEIAAQKGVHAIQASKVSACDMYIAGLTASMQTLQARIDARVDQRIKQGVVSEVKKLISAGYSWDLPSMSGLGYIQWKPYAGQMPVNNTGEIPPELIVAWKHAEYLYAKRQMTWFKKYKKIVWYDVAGLGYPDNVTKDILSWYTESNDEYES